MTTSPIKGRSARRRAGFGAATRSVAVRAVMTAGVALVFAGLIQDPSLAQTQPGSVGAPVKLAPPKEPPPLVPDNYGKSSQGTPATGTPSQSQPGTQPGTQPAAGPSGGTSTGTAAGAAAGAAPAAGTSGGQPAEAGPQMPPPTVQVSPLQAVNPDSVGVLTDQTGGLGIDMWKGTPRALVERLLPALPATSFSRTARDLTRRLLLTAAAAPEGQGGKSLLGLRARRLEAMGDAKDMAALLDASAQTDNDELTRLRVEALLLSGQMDPACDKVETAIRAKPSGYWQKNLIFCQMVSGKKSEARLGLSLFRETDNGKDPAFLYMASTLLGDHVKGGLPPVGPEAVDIAMLRLMGKSFPASAADTDNPEILAAIAVAPDADPAVRLAAGERAEAEGALSPDALGDIYASISFTADELNNALSMADKEGGVRARALLYQAVRQEQIPVARAEALRAALQLAKKDGRLPTMARVTLPLLLDIKPDAQLAWFAPDAARALLAGGKLDAALAWYDLVAAGHDPDSKRAELELRPLVLLARAQSGAGDDAMFQDWLDIMKKGPPTDTAAAAAPSQDPAPSDASSQGASGASAQPPVAAPPSTPPESAAERQRKAGLVLGLLDAMGVQLDARDWDAFVTPDRRSAAMPGLSLWSALRAAARDGRRGETVMLALIALGNGDLANTDPIIVDGVISALESVGLADDARALAVETAIAQGL